MVFVPELLQHGEISGANKKWTKGYRGQWNQNKRNNKKSRQNVNLEILSAF